MSPMRTPALALVGLLGLLAGGDAALAAPAPGGGAAPGAMEARPAAMEARPEAMEAPRSTAPGATLGPREAPGEPGHRPAMASGEPDEPPPDAEPAPPEEPTWRPIELEATGITWLGPGQRGLIEAHPLVMGLAAMALATVTLLFFFLRGVKRPRDEALDGKAPEDR